MKPGNQRRHGANTCSLSVMMGNENAPRFLRVFLFPKIIRRYYEKTIYF